MTDKFEIRVRCANCGHETVLSSDGNLSAPLLFDNPEDAFLHVSDLKSKKKPVRLLDRAMGLDDNQRSIFECPERHALFPAHDLTINVFRQS